MQLAPNPALIQIMLGQALLATNNKAHADEAVTLLEAASRREPESPEAFNQIAMAYGRKGDLARADLASAQAAFVRGDLQDRARARGPRQDAFPGRLAGLGARPTTSRATSRKPRPTLIISKRTSTMKFYFRPLAVALVVLAAAMPTFDRARAQPFSPDQRGEIEKIVRDYLLRNPEMLQEVIQEMERRQAQADAEKHREAIKETRANASSIRGGRSSSAIRRATSPWSSSSTTIAASAASALTDKLELIKTDPKLRLVLKEFPVLGEGSTQAAQVAVAVRMQDKTGGKKYLEFHQKMFASRGQIDKARALAVVREIGLDAARAERDMASDEVQATLEEGFKLAEALGINGTPSYVLAGQVVVGAVGVEKLRDAINTARCGKATC